MKISGADLSVRCPLCGGLNADIWRFGLLCCRECVFVFSPLVAEQGANEAMEDVYFGEDYEPEKSSWVARFEQHNNQDTLTRIACARPPGSRLLEVGVGSGSLLRAARESGFEVQGCDLSERVCRLVEARHGVPMHRGPLSELAPESFDVVVLNHVLEHVSHPVHFLREVGALLRPGGIAHVRVPNVACPEARLRGWTSFEPYHLLYFTPRTLADAIARSGLRVDQMLTRESFSGWLLTALRTALGHNREPDAVFRPRPAPLPRGGGRSGWLEHAYRLASIGFGAVSWPLRRLQAFAGRGDEIVCLVRRPGRGEPG